VPWVPIAVTEENDTLLELFEKDGRFMIRANGLELMNGYSHDSETAFGLLAAELARGDHPAILVGGLGLGYTTAALVGALGPRGRITVAEFSPAVIAWFHAHVRPSVLPQLPGNLAIIEAEVLGHLWASPRYDLVLLDVDNGPEPLVRADNAQLYGKEGLRVLRSRVADDGAVLLWSGFESPDFEKRARHAGFSVARRKVSNGARAALDHHLYVLTADA